MNTFMSMSSRNGESYKQKTEELTNSNFNLVPTNITNGQDHMIQVRPDKPYMSSFPGDFFPGVINPLKKRTILKNLNIDTRFRENYYANSSTNFNFTLPITLNNVVQMQLSAIELPNTFYVVSKQYGNNFFTISVNNYATVVNIPDGNYDNSSIMTAINNQLVFLGAPFNTVRFVVNLTDNITGSNQTLVGFTNLDKEENLSISLNFQADRYGIEDRNTPLPLKFGWLLGFRNGVYVNNVNYVSEGCVDTRGPKYFFLVVDDHNNSVNNNFYSAFNSSILNKNILARISLQQNFTNATQYSAIGQKNVVITAPPREYFGPVNITNVNVQLLDEYGRIVNLNNMDFSFCINLNTAYDL